MTDLARPRVLVFGAGAVGTLLGGILSGGGYDVTLLGRSRSIVTIQQDGLTVQLQDRRFQPHPAIATSTDELDSPFDIVLLTVRTYAVAKAIDQMAQGSLIAREGMLVSLQNGIGTEELIATRLPGIAHVAGSLTISADLPQAGVVSSSSRSGGIALAPVTPEAASSRIAEMFHRSGLPVTEHVGYRSMKWSKLLLNQMANGIPAILDWRPGQLYRHDAAFRIEQAMLLETLRVIEADGAGLVSLPGFPVPILKWVLRLPPWVARRLLLGRVEGGRGEKLPSLLLDLRAGRTELEAEWLYGAVAGAGERVGVPAPINRRVNSILNGMAANPELRQRFRNQPELLIHNVHRALE